MSERAPGQESEPDPSKTGEADGADRFRGSTGRDLRARREGLGLDLGEVSDVLRIRREYLEALEEGDYGTLPGHTYAVGFVRSYARHLGLDGEAAARQFKIEVAGERPATRLEFPEPLAESRIPTGAVVLVTVLLAAATYGVWYYLNARDVNFSDMVPEVPSGFTAETATTTAPDGGPAAVAAGSPEPAPASVAAAPPPAGEAPAPAQASTADAAAETPEALRMVDDGAVESARQGAEPAVAEEAPTPVPEAAPAAPDAPVPDASPNPAAAPAAAEITAAVREEPAPTASSPPPPQPPRIEIRAVADSWVQVRDAKGSLLMTRIMIPGSSYAVPPEKGLTLMTGNAGGLEILVDGAAVPPLGPFGAVRRNVALDPERLKEGSAIQR